MNKFAILLSTLLLACFQPRAASANELTLAVHPILSRAETLRIYQPMVDYLTKATGQRFALTTSTNLLTHWELTKRGHFDFILEGPHFVDYHVKKRGYEVLAKMPNLTSFTLVAHEKLMIIDPGELIGRPVATPPSPGLSALRLEQIYTNPLRQPRIVEVDSFEEAAKRVLEGKADGAMIPAPMVARYPQLATVLNTPHFPSPGLIASPGLSAAIKATVRQALLDASENEEGRVMLQSLKISAFEPATAASFEGHITLLEGVWGY